MKALIYISFRININIWKVLLTWGEKITKWPETCFLIVQICTTIRLRKKRQFLFLWRDNPICHDHLFLRQIVSWWQLCRENDIWFFEHWSTSHIPLYFERTVPTKMGPTIEYSSPPAAMLPPNTLFLQLRHLFLRRIVSWWQLCRENDVWFSKHWSMSFSFLFFEIIQTPHPKYPKSLL